jgi:hypothetical protein
MDTVEGKQSLYTRSPNMSMASLSKHQREQLLYRNLALSFLSMDYAIILPHSTLEVKHLLLKREI